MRLWLDLVNTPEALFFDPIMQDLRAHHKAQITVRNRAETEWLASFLGMDHRTVGGDSEGWLGKRIRFAGRTLLLQRLVGPFEAALSFGNPNSVVVAQWRGRPNVVFEDNDLDWAPGRSLTDEIVRRIVWASTFKVVPKAFPIHRLLAAGVPEDSVYAFDGFKEQVYLAEFHPDPSFRETLPEDPYVVVRPEAGSSSYVSHVPSLVPALLEAFEDRDIQAVYLPRVSSDRAFLNGGRTHVPTHPVFGPDLVWNAACVLTGSGTMAREAACLGVPAISFFPGRNAGLLSVDSQLIEEGRMVHSRNLADLLSYVQEALQGGARRRPMGTSRTTRRKVVTAVKEILRRVEGEDFPNAPRRAYGNA